VGVRVHDQSRPKAPFRLEREQTQGTST
jgi:hypothetical protein